MCYLLLSFAKLKEFYKNQHFHYSDEILFNLYNSLKTKPFIILSGVSGSGKSKIIDLFAEYFSKELSYEENYELVPVKPNWTDSRALFGYHNIIDNTYAITPVIKIFLRALQNPDKPYFLVLDEMNLAKVEHYFSDFLSIIESRKYEHTKVENKKIDIKTLKSELRGTISLSQAIILSALQLDSEKFETIETYRNLSISQWWLSNSSSNNPEAQYRTELNQGRNKGSIQKNGYKADGERLAGRAFWAEVQGDSYKLKKPEEMDSATKKDFEHIKTIYDKLTRESNNTVGEITRIKQHRIVLHSCANPLKTQENQEEFSGILYSKEVGYYVPSEIEIPLNVFVIGTVNIDETTYMFSPKVLDRSNVIEFNDIDIKGAYGFSLTDGSVSQSELQLTKDELDLSISLSTTEDTIKFSTDYSREFKILVEIFEELKTKNKHFGYRVFNEISLYILNYIDHIPTDVGHALDNQILQKILPKLSGDIEELEDILLNIKSIIPDSYSKSISKLDEMIDTLQSTGYVTFIK